MGSYVGHANAMLTWIVYPRISIFLSVCRTQKRPELQMFRNIALSCIQASVLRMKLVFVFLKISI